MFQKFEEGLQKGVENVLERIALVMGFQHNNWRKEIFKRFAER
jgi:hypothetical protein